MQFVVALFPIGHEGIVGHRGTRLVEIGFDAVVHRYFGILTLREALADNVVVKPGDAFLGLSADANALTFNFKSALDVTPVAE